jgi:hypothetical protein
MNEDWLLPVRDMTQQSQWQTEQEQCIINPRVLILNVMQVL